MCCADPEDDETEGDIELVDHYLPPDVGVRPRMTHIHHTSTSLQRLSSGLVHHPPPPREVESSEHHPKASGLSFAFSRIDSMPHTILAPVLDA